MRERSFALRAHSRSLTYPFTQKLGHSLQKITQPVRGMLRCDALSGLDMVRKCTDTWGFAPVYQCWSVLRSFLMST